MRVEQPTLFRESQRVRDRRDRGTKAKAFDRANAECAEIILGDPGKYGTDGLMVEWARKVVAKNGTGGCAIMDSPSLPYATEPLLTPIKL
jgi:hypothetical protein